MRSQSEADTSLARLRNRWLVVVRHRRRAGRAL